MLTVEIVKRVVFKFSVYTLCQNALLINLWEEHITISFNRKATLSNVNNCFLEFPAKFCR